MSNAARMMPYDDNVPPPDGPKEPEGVQGEVLELFKQRSHGLTTVAAKAEMKHRNPQTVADAVNRLFQAGWLIDSGRTKLTGVEQKRATIVYKVNPNPSIQPLPPKASKRKSKSKVVAFVTDVDDARRMFTKIMRKLTRQEREEQIQKATGEAELEFVKKNLEWTAEEYNGRPSAYSAQANSKSNYTISVNFELSTGKIGDYTVWFYPAKPASRRLIGAAIKSLNNAKAIAQNDYESGTGENS